MQPGKSIVLNEGLPEACEYIRGVYQKQGISIPAGSWLWANLLDSERLARGEKIGVADQEQMDRAKMYLLGITANIQMFYRNLKVCLEKGADLQGKLEEVLSMGKANSTIHEIHNLACLLRAGLDAHFIERDGGKTPDISVVGKGVLECKTVTSEKAIARELVKSSKQMRDFEGEKVTDFYLYLLGVPITEEYLDNLWKKSVLAVKNDLERIKAFNGFSFSYSRVIEGPNGQIGLEAKSHRWIVGDSLAGRDILRALQITL